MSILTITGLFPFDCLWACCSVSVRIIRPHLCSTCDLTPHLHAPSAVILPPTRFLDGEWLFGPSLSLAPPSSSWTWVQL
ncbi:hypothetical protein DFH09DRAFT_1171964 [Mycena vulgaris]|nr:hypothetical protein DFH09DRAFT_1171964 [Mycena vulgaris]